MHFSFPKFRTTLAAGLVALMGFGAPMEAFAVTNFNQVGKHLLIMLRNFHFKKRKFDVSFSQELLSSYVEYLDANKLYFLQSDIDRFQRKYAGDILVHILNSEGVDAANDIHSVFVQRVKERNEKILEILENTDFDFTGDATIQMSRKDAAWPANADEADQIWRKRIEASILEELLRQLDQKLEKNQAIDPSIAENGSWKELTDIAEAREKILNRYKRISSNVEATDNEEVADMFFSSIAGMYDPHSDYFSHSEEEQFRTSMMNKLTGIGAILQALDDGTTQIKGIVVGGPADKAGNLALDDKIIAVDSNASGEFIDITYMKIGKVVELIRGDAGTDVRLKIIPSAEPTATREIVIKRDTVELKDNLATAELIHWKTDAGNRLAIGWISIPSFYKDLSNGTTSLTRDVRVLLKRLMSEGMDGLVVDLRGNGGGSLDEAIALTGLFIPAGPVVQAKSSTGALEVHKSNTRYPMYDGPLSVLTDKTSASASEIFAAALQDYNRAVIIGDKSTFGKGTVQNVLPVSRAMPMLADGTRAGSLKVTIQKFYRIAGGSTQLDGVVPDVILPSRYDALEIGEDSLADPLPHDDIAAQDYKPFNSALLNRDLLAKRSHQRIAKSKEFQYIKSDIDRIKEQMERNTLAVNLRKRLEEKAEMEQQRKTRVTEQKARFEELHEYLSDRMEIREITLDNASDEEIPVVTDFSKDNSAMRHSTSDDKNRSEDLDYPFGLDPAKRETLFIMSDLIALGQKKALKPVAAQISSTQ